MNARTLIAATNKVYAFAALYVLTLLIAAAIANYLFSTPGPETAPGALAWGLWVALYLPCLIFPMLAGWQLADLGLYLNSRLLAAVGIVFLLVISCPATAALAASDWYTAATEAFARAGEEFFFRGFLYTLIFKLCQNKSRPWLWAILLSSLLFALVHTQTLHPGSRTDMFNIFLLAAVFACVRYWTSSILPGIIIHTALMGGIPSVLGGIIIYIVFSLIAHFKGERLDSEKLLSG